MATKFAAKNAPSATAASDGGQSRAGFREPKAALENRGIRRLALPAARLAQQPKEQQGQQQPGSAEKVKPHAPVIRFRQPARNQLPAIVPRYTPD